ncbi:MAG TPA: hypothetical protein VD995_07340 [Azospirillum sp.]|nr:hypothetical protein [Azospirillum sp.]
MSGLIDDDETGTIAYRDLMTLLFGGMSFMLAVAVPFLADAKKVVQETAGLTPPGNVVVDARWADGSNDDIDLWVQAPGDVPVGYSNKSGLIFNLLRDDLGRPNPPGVSLRMETAISRGIPPGEYVVNLHLYRQRDNKLPLPVTVTVHCKPNNEARAADLLTKQVELRREGEELTAVRFRLEDNCGFDNSSVNTLQKPLRAAAAKS